MEDLAAAVGAAVNVMQFPMELWGFTVSFWQIGLWGMVAGIAWYAVWRILNG